MIFISYALFLITFIFGILFEYKNKSPFIIFYCGILLVSIIPSLINIIEIGNRLYDDSVYIEANLFSFVFLSVFLFFRYIFINMFKTNSIWVDFLKEDKGSRELIIVYILLLLICFSLFIVGLKIYSLNAMMSLNWWDLVRSGSVLVVLATYLSYASSGIILASSQSLNFKEKIFAYFLSTVFILFSVFVLKTRSYVLMFLVPLFIYMIYTKKGKELLRPLFFFVVIVFLFIFARAVRHSTDLETFINSDISSSFMGASEGAETSFINAFYYYIYFNNNFDGFEENITLRRIVFFWYPAIKPIEFSYYMHSAYFGSSPSEGLSMHPTVFGDAYANAWWFGAFIYSIFLSFYISFLEFLSKFFSQTRPYFKIVLFSVIGITGLIFARGAIYNAFMYSFLPILLMFLILKLIFNFRQKK